MEKKKETEERKEKIPPGLKILPGLKSNIFMACFTTRWAGPRYTGSCTSYSYAISVVLNVVGDTFSGLTCQFSTYAKETGRGS